MLRRRKSDHHRALSGLREARTELGRDLRRLLHTPEDPARAHDDLGPAERDRDVGLAVLEMKSRTCRGIEDALHRLQSGSYGRCDVCARAISAARLKALPFATRCRACQESVERRRGEWGPAWTAPAPRPRVGPPRRG
jgi:DnaK suppressor protein